MTRSVFTCFLAAGLAAVTPQYHTWGWELGHVVSSVYLAILVTLLADALAARGLCALHHRSQPPPLPDLTRPEETRHALLPAVPARPPAARR